MKNIILWLCVILLALGSTACSDDPQFPDPAFDLISDKNIVIRRDTASAFMLELNVKAPGGVDFIQILDGREFKVLEKLTEDQGKTDFHFSHKIDFSGIPETRDTVLIYNVRIVTLDQRAFNSSFKLDVKKLSFPEILLPHNDRLGVTAPVVGIRGIVSTGINTISGIRFYLDNEKVYEVPQGEFEGLHEYKVVANVAHYFMAGQEYDLRIEIEDNTGQIGTSHITILGVKLQKPKSLLIKRDGVDFETFDFEYDEQERMTKFDFADLRKGGEINEAHVELIYRPDGKVSHFNIRMPASVPGYLMHVDFTYDEGGRLIKVERLSREDQTGMDYPKETIQNFVYREDGTVGSFDANINTIREVQYIDGFIPGEKIMTEQWTFPMSGMTLSGRMVRTGFTPVMMPAYVEGLPPFFFYPYLDNWIDDLFLCKYIFTEKVAGPGNPNTNPASHYPNYQYTMDEQGRLETFTRLTYRYAGLDWADVVYFRY